MESLSLHTYSYNHCPSRTHCSPNYQPAGSSTISLTRYQTLPQVSKNSLTFNLGKSHHLQAATYLHLFTDQRTVNYESSGIYLYPIYV